MYIQFDDRGREILDDMPASFILPDQRRISTLDFHRQRLLEQREALRRMMEELKEDSEFETFAEANDFRVRDDFDEDAEFSDFELDDDNLDGVETLARKEYQRIVESSARKTEQKNLSGNDS